MFPWGHLAFGYLLFSPAVRLWQRRAPAGLAVLALAVGTQLPDLVDKSLSWVFHLAPTGYSVAHSVFVAVPVCLAVGALLIVRGRSTVGFGFAVGYLSHLVGDVLLAVALRQPYTVERVLWPTVTLPGYASERPALDRTLSYIVEWAEFLLASENHLLLAVYLSPLVAALLLWLLDGAPGVPRPERERL
ncbi:metal-dependent hydrolase [Halorarius litoreus]|uniref:metal-dependent hydrolase n=1 Tax=Halorarius litoreus TaxID=2962676 RepID=UPI0020CC6E2E|nr:metal-dependent hydrolase [Halorarius litoreus]